MTFVAENAKGDKDAPSYFGGGHLTSTQYWTKLFFRPLSFYRFLHELTMLPGLFRAYLVFDTEQEFYYKWLSVT